MEHIITNQGVKVNQDKVQVMINWLRSTITELQEFLGLTGYYRKFVQDYGNIARQLTNLLKKGQLDGMTKQNSPSLHSNMLSPLRQHWFYPTSMNQSPLRWMPREMEFASS